MEHTDLRSTDDAHLVELAKANPDFFAVLVDRYWQRLFSYARRMSYFPDEDIEDILQEVFIKVYKNLNDYDRSYKFSTWIYQITRNCIIDMIRKRNCRPIAIQLEERELQNLFRESTNLHSEVIAKDTLSKVKEIIDALPMEYREVMILRFLEEKSYEEIMDIVKKPKGTVSTLINRARKKINEEALRQGLISR